jgi:hypothetical protein
MAPRNAVAVAKITPARSAVGGCASIGALRYEPFAHRDHARVTTLLGRGQNAEPRRSLRSSPAASAASPAVADVNMTTQSVADGFEGFGEHALQRLADVDTTNVASGRNEWGASVCVVTR